MARYSGIIAASCAYIIWGVLPVYWKALQTVPALEILCHRMTWSLFVTLGIILCVRRFAAFRQALANRRNLGIFGASALLLAVNWLIYIWAVNAGYILEASLGYFINPLISVVFGVFFFKERLRPGQIAALVLVVIGVLYLTIYYGRFPWIALSLSVTFAVYGLLHKKSSLPSMDALGIEVLLFFLPAAAYLLLVEFTGSGAIQGGTTITAILLIGAGVVTTLPLLLFGFAAHKIPLSTLGLLQYMAPTISFFIGILLYHEEFPRERMIGFSIIWTALALYLAEGTIRRVRGRRAVLGELRS
ncbi:EamA family transporter RarD [Desulfoprunum benzoelyticum]|uniref:Chloramphenicol-sensitive protein RarD n=1 Tax=Desulfoprunum benzoelyticum TaxID=1506996 RepID=A0A840UTY4_9BACT|nr:EamA family transporter RarD [Desulfoprunum benzoelyticum]MBB5349145.1 chloramphenicol-sensitive protein RarD [Desulfoprunum benzoelyticum]MBM9530617.1 EamA family transporter RarD [Desulfoprunum benzoelyticum]